VITARDLEMWICGKNKVDFELLKRFTKYSGGLTWDSPRVKLFWEVV